MSEMFFRIIKPSQAWIKFLLALLALLFLAASISGHLKPVENLLSTEQLTFRIGDINFTLYLMLKGIIAIIALFWCAGLVSGFGEARIRKIKSMRASNKTLVIKTFQIAVYFLTFLFALNIIGIDLTALAVFSGAVGIGLGFGLQKITSNFVSGIILLFEKSIEPDDIIELESGIFGTIKTTKARYTLVETFDGKEVMIPNEDFVTTRVVNWTYTSTQGRVEISIGVSYSSDINLAHKLILEAATEHPLCLKNPEPNCYLSEFADSSVNFTLHFWIENMVDGRLKPKSEVMFDIWNKFAKNNIEIPFPQLDLHIKNISDLKGKFKDEK